MESTAFFLRLARMKSSCLTASPHNSFPLSTSLLVSSSSSFSSPFPTATISFLSCPTTAPTILLLTPASNKALSMSPSPSTPWAPIDSATSKLWFSGASPMSPCAPIGSPEKLKPTKPTCCPLLNFTVSEPSTGSCTTNLTNSHSTLRLDATLVSLSNPPPTAPLKVMKPNLSKTAAPKLPFSSPSSISLGCRGGEVPTKTSISLGV
mmetsp:Transcript_16925/g.34830  ORF Transcript_16925/g.34830 Transcript_16925/m.34830 type:complete len:207 (-) Transcript_16925:361-981(-)